MSTGGRVLALSIGILGGGGLGFWYKETHWVRKNEEKCKELEKELDRLVELRRKKEKQLDESSVHQ